MRDPLKTIGSEFLITDSFMNRRRSHRLKQKKA